MDAVSCSCPCGRSAFRVTGRPLFRFTCHCTICQSLYERPYADVIALRAAQIEPESTEHLIHRRLRPPLSVDRRICPDCSRPVFGTIPMMPGIVMGLVPASNFPETACLPEIGMHTFYDRRAEDHPVAARVVSGFLASQLAVTAALARTWRAG